MRATILLLALGAGCADPVIDLSMAVPAMPTGFDVSCVTSVEVAAVGNERGGANTPPDVVSSCIDLKTPPSSFADIRAAIHGRVDLRIPESGLAGIQLRGTTGACSDANRFYEANFYGGAVYADGDSLAVPVVANISCNAKRTYAVSSIDLMALDRTKSCAMSIPDPAQQPVVFAGNIRPQLLGPSFARTVFEDGPSAATMNAAGKASIESYERATGATSCIAAGFDGRGRLAGSCINPAAPTLCAGPNEIELAVIDPIYAGASIESALVQQYGQPVFGAVYRQSGAAQKLPIAGATVELADPTQGKVIYVAPGTSKLMPLAGATGTDPSGFFIVYLKGDATSVTVKAGASEQRYTIASQGDLPPTLLAVLP
jgi:hypothetical protein